MDDSFNEAPVDIIEESHAWGPDLDLTSLVGKADQVAYVAISRVQPNGRPGDYMCRVDLGADLLVSRRFLAEKADEAQHIDAIRAAIYHELRQITLETPERYLLQFRAAKGSTTLFTRMIFVTPLRPMVPETPFASSTPGQGHTSDPLASLRDADTQHALPALEAIHRAMRMGADSLTSVNSVIAAHLATVLQQKDAVITALTRQGLGQDREIENLRRRVRELEADLAEAEMPRGAGRRREDISKAIEGLKEGLGPIRELIGFSGIPDKLKAMMTPDNMAILGKPEVLETIELAFKAAQERKAP